MINLIGLICFIIFLSQTVCGLPAHVFIQLLISQSALPGIHFCGKWQNENFCLVYTDLSNYTTITCNTLFIGPFKRLIKCIFGGYAEIVKLILFRPSCDISVNY